MLPESISNAGPTPITYLLVAFSRTKGTPKSHSLRPSSFAVLRKRALFSVL